MSARHAIPAQVHRVEALIRRSRFIATAAHAPTPEAAKVFIASIRTEFPDATHNCWAFVAGPPGSTAHIGQSDDGEPHGTAGRPMISVLLHSAVGEVAVVVTRYFGGIKLGTGGLVRAYSDLTRLVLDSLPLKEKVHLARLCMVVSYEHVDGLRRLLPVFEAVVIDETFAADATISVALPEEHATNFSRAITDLTNGLALIDTVNT